MAITTYQELQDAVARFMNRSDLATVIPDFITIAEGRIALTVRAAPMLKRETLTQAAGTSDIAVPDDWLEWDRLAMQGENETLEYVPFARFTDSVLASGDAAHSGKYTMDGTTLIVGKPIPAGDPDVLVDVSYYARIPSLAQAGSETNWLLTAHPEVYLYGTLVSGWQYLLDEQRAAGNASLFDGAVQTVNSIHHKAQLSGSMWRQRPR
jgi:hypothetical protein